MATASRATRRSVQPSAAPASTKNSRQPTGQRGPSQSRQPTGQQRPSQSRQPSQAKATASRGQNGGTRTGTQAQARTSKQASKAGSKAASKAGTRQGTRASQKKPGGEPVLATVGEDGQIIVGDKDPAEGTGGEAEGEEEEEYYEDGEYYDEDEEYEEGEYDEEEDEEGEEEEEEEYYEEEEEEEFDYSTFQYRPYGQRFERDPDEPRVTIATGPEACSCFPARSNRNIPSMLYDKVDCEHQSLQGYAHLGVYRFDDNWDNRHETTLKPKLADRLMPNRGYVWGYPNFIFVEAEDDQGVGEDEEEDEYYDEEGGGEDDQYDEEGEYDEDGERYDEDGEEYEDDEGEEYDEEGEQYDEDEEEEELPDEKEEGEPEREGYYDEYGDYHYFEDGASLPSRMFDSQGRLLSREQSVKAPSTAPKPSSALEAILPRIGYSPTPSPAATPRVATVPQTPAAKTLSLPPITPASDQGSYVASREKTPVRFKPRTLQRTFQGKYYDPMTKQSYEFEITPDFRRRIDRWHVKKEGMGQVGGSGSGPQSGRETANASRANSRYSQTSGAYDKEVVTRW